MVTKTPKQVPDLDQNEFVDAFLPVLGADAGDVHLLFMRIDADSDGTVTWEEFLSYVLSQDLGFCANVARYCGVARCGATIDSRDMESKFCFCKNNKRMMMMGDLAS
jgi:hypothetical protein